MTMFYNKKTMITLSGKKLATKKEKRETKWEKIFVIHFTKS